MAWSDLNKERKIVIIFGNIIVFLSLLIFIYLVFKQDPITYITGIASLMFAGLMMIIGSLVDQTDDTIYFYLVYSLTAFGIICMGQWHDSKLLSSIGVAIFIVTYVSSMLGLSDKIEKVFFDSVNLSYALVGFILAVWGSLHPDNMSSRLLLSISIVLLLLAAISSNISLYTCCHVK